MSETNKHVYTRDVAPCGCSFERWGRDSFKISVCDEHRGTAGLLGEPVNAAARMVGERHDQS